LVFNTALKIAPGVMVELMVKEDMPNLERVKRRTVRGRLVGREVK
jgi:hypothetical protein